MFAKGSRYENVPEYETSDAQSRTVRYKGTRFIEPLRAQKAHIVTAGERLDHIAYYYYRDPERFWRICDANLVLWPEELTDEMGRKIVIPSSEG